jgi:hypothetical protein
MEEGGDVRAQTSCHDFTLVGPNEEVVGEERIGVFGLCAAVVVCV